MEQIEIERVNGRTYIRARKGKPVESEKSLIPKDTMYYQMELDLVNNEVHVYMGEGEIEDEVEAADGSATTYFSYAPDGLPLVQGVTIRNPNKVSIIRDWIEDAIEACVEQMNALPKDDFGNDHWKGFMIDETTLS